MKRILTPIWDFIQKEINSGIVLLVVTFLALLIANSPFSDHYFHFFENIKIGIDFDAWVLKKSLSHWINDGLMAIFFFLVGLEIKREILIGELSSIKNALFPLIAALGGMVVPAVFFTIINFNSPEYLNGWAIPMATDIAFALGILALLKSKVPVELKIFLTSLAIVDDLGAVLTIAFFYSDTIALGYVAWAISALILLFILNKLGVRLMWLYVIIGITMVWYPLLKSGIHATIAGVLLAMTIPARRKMNTYNFIKTIRENMDEMPCCQPSENTTMLNQIQYSIIEDTEKQCDAVISPLQKLEHNLHDVTLYAIMPLFAFANTGIQFDKFDFSYFFTSRLSIGIFLGLFLGKVVGISLFTFVFQKLKIINIPKSLSWKHIIGAGFLAGIGFTMSIFITDLAFQDPSLIVTSKIAILLTSVASGLVGYFIIKSQSKHVDDMDA